MVSQYSIVGSMLLVPLAAACQFSMSTGGPDYPKLEGAITEELNDSYKGISRKVTRVDCPRADTLKAGDTFICTADVDGNAVRVQVRATDDDGNVDFSTLDTVFELSQTADGLATQISKKHGFDVTVDCGEGLKVVAVGQSFECTAAARSGDTRTVKVTAGAAGETDRWEILGE